MENKQSKSKKPKAPTTRESIDNNFTELNKNLNELDNNSSEDIDLKMANKVLKNANKTIRNLNTLLTDTYIKQELNEEEKLKNEKFLKKEFK